MPEPFDAVQFLSTILVEHGPLHEDDIVRHLRKRGVADPEAVWEEVLEEDGCAAGLLLDDRWIWLPAVLAGRVFTHWVDADEVAHDFLAISPDLEAITELCEESGYQRLADGSAVQVVLPEFDDELLDERGTPLEVVDPDGALLLAPGTLNGLGVADGDAVGLRLTDQGLVVERVTEFADSPAGARFTAMVEADEPVSLDSAVLTACAEDPTLFTEPLPPLSEIFDDAGLTQRSDQLASSGFDFDQYRFDRGCAAIADRHNFDADDAFTVYSLVQLFDQMSMILEAAEDDDLSEDVGADTAEDVTPLGSDEFDALVGKLAADLADPLLAEALVAETVDSGRGGAAALGMFADVLEPKVPRSARVACQWLRAVALDRIGDLEGAERELLAAESTDPDWPLPLLDLARLASCRGDAERGLSLLHRAGAEPENPLLEVLERHRAQPRSDLVRNEPCWCGSGRKYKKCHLGRETLPLAERADWLYAKAADHVFNSGWMNMLIEVAYERGRYADDDDLDALLGYVTDPLVLDAVLFEGGAYADFLVRRASLLPDDEQELADQWLGVSRSVFEVEEVRRGQGFAVRDLRTGDRHDVTERTASRHLKQGQLFCARVVPVVDTMQIFGGLEPIALHERSPLIELLDGIVDPVTLVEALSRRFAPPTLITTENESIMFCEATIRVGDPAGLEVALDDVYDRVDGSEPPGWLEHVTTQGMQRIRATLTLDGDTVKVQTNSQERMDRVLARLTRLDPNMKVLNESRRTPDEFAMTAGPVGEGALDSDDPAVAAALAEYIRTYETNWLDESIPALDGYTPRQAADDTTRRGDLIKLLDTFPAGDAARGGMDADRLRSALGLD